MTDSGTANGAKFEGLASKLEQGLQRVHERTMTEDWLAVRFEVGFPAGSAERQTWLHQSNGQAGGAFFAEVE